MAHTLFAALNGYASGSGMSPLLRVQSKDYTAPHGIKVYQMVFRFRQTEDC